MNRYLLLRDNKQSGPYTVPELIEKGIKAYDLVWLDGKSAAWRYPSEIEELKPYAPIVEEQPFDRFYKKPAAEKHFIERAANSANETRVTEVPAQDNNVYRERYQSAPEKSVVRASEEAVLNADSTKAKTSVPDTLAAAEAVAKTTIQGTVTSMEATAKPSIPETSAPPIDNYSSQGSSQGSSPGYSPGEPAASSGLPPHEGPRKIYVTLPGAKAVTRINAEAATPPALASQSERLTERPAPPAPEVYRDEQSPYAKSDQGQNERFAPMPSPRYRKIESEYKKPEQPDTSFSSKFTGADLLTDTVFPGKSKKSLLAGKQNAAIMIMAALCLLLGGIIIGLAISNSKKESAKELNNLVRQIQERERLKQLPASQPVARTEEPLERVTESAIPGAEEKVVTEKPPSNPNSQARLAISRNVAKNDKLPEAPPVQAISPDVQPVKVQPAVQEDNSVSSAAVELARKNIRQLVSLQSSKYKTGVLGGISDLSLTVTNKSEFEIDRVEVEVTYLGPEKRVVKTQTIVFNNIKAGNQLTLDVPRTNRGVSVTTNIKVINSKSLGLSQSGA